MKTFVKENLINILLLIFLGLCLILWGRIIVSDFLDDANKSAIETREDRVRCLRNYGWEVDITSETEEKIYIPMEFDAVYKRYNDLQKMCGFDLEKYKGESVLKYTFRVTNFPEHENAEVFVNLLIKDGKMIGGDCFTVALDGFMLPIDRRHLD